jgi:hypothetical protein
VAGFCEHGNEPSVSIMKALFDKLSDFHLFKEYPTPWSKQASMEYCYVA